MNGPDQILSAYNLISTNPDDCVMIRTNDIDNEDTEFIPPISAVSLLRNASINFGDQVALRVKRNDIWQEWSYKQYWNEAKTVAKAFIKLGLERHHSVCILGFNSPEWLFSQFGAILAGGLATGIYTTNSAEACKYIIEHSKADILVAEDSKQFEKFPNINEFLSSLKTAIQYTGSPAQDGILSWKELVNIGDNESDDKLNDRMKRIAINQACSLIYTSGTTGPPKGVMLSHDNVTWLARAMNKSLKIKANERLVSYLPLSHSAAQMTDIWLPISCGATINFADKNALKGSLIETWKEVRPQHLLGVPRVFEKIMEKMQDMGRNAPPAKRVIAKWAKKTGLEYNKRILTGQSTKGKDKAYKLAKKVVFDKVKYNLGLDCAKFIGIGAAPVSKECLEYFLSLDIQLCEGYGMSETAGPHTGNLPGFQRLGSIGPPFQGFKIKIENPDETGEGEIVMSSRNIMMGYLFNEEKTKEAIDENGWLHSGDLGTELDNGFFRITGRIKELIITAGGENVAPIPIEEAIKKELNCISNAMVVGDQRKFLTCLLAFKVEADPETLEPTDKLTKAAKDWCIEEAKCEVHTLKEVLWPGLAHETIMAHIQRGINRVNLKAVSNAQKVQKWVVLPRDFSVQGQELGPTLKLKRHAVMTKYSSTIDAMYKS